MLENRKPDRRVARTRRALWQALRTLLGTHDWNDINIRMICDTADVARSSFYVHFDNKTALLDFGFDDTTKELEGLIRQSSGKDADLVCLHWLFDHVAADTRSFRRMFHSASNSAVYHRFRRTLERSLAAEFELQGRQVPIGQVAFVVGGALSLIHDWIEQGGISGEAETKASMLGYTNRVLGIRP